MFFGLFWGDWTIFLLIPAMMFALWAQFRVQSTFHKYDKVLSSSNMTGAEAARRILDKNGIYDVRVERISGHLSDHFDPRTKVIRLSDSTYGSNSVAAIGVAAHEAGHAVQYATGYAPIRLRQAIVPMTRFGSALAMPLFLIGLLLVGFGAINPTVGEYMMFGGIVLFSLSTIFQLITLPVEFNASKRAILAIKNENLTTETVSGVRKVLTAAAMTYVTAMLITLANLMRFLVRSRRR